VDYKQVALGNHGNVYSHLVDTLKWSGVKDVNTRKTLVKDSTARRVGGVKGAAHVREVVADR